MAHILSTEKTSIIRHPESSQSNISWNVWLACLRGPVILSQVWVFGCRGIGIQIYTDQTQLEQYAQIVKLERSSKHILGVKINHIWKTTPQISIGYLHASSTFKTTRSFWFSTGPRFFRSWPEFQGRFFNVTQNLDDEKPGHRWKKLASNRPKKAPRSLRKTRDLSPQRIPAKKRSMGNSLKDPITTKEVTYKEWYLERQVSYFFRQLYP